MGCTDAAAVAVGSGQAQLAKVWGQDMPWWKTPSLSVASELQVCHLCARCNQWRLLAIRNAPDRGDCPKGPPSESRWLWHFTVRTESSASCHPKISKENSGQKASATVIMWLFCNCRPFSPGKSRPSFRNSSGLLHWIWEIILSYVINVVSPMINHPQVVVLYPHLGWSKVTPKIFGHWNGLRSGLPHCPLAWSSACHTQQRSAKSWHCEGLPADSKTCLHDFKPLLKVNTPRRNPKKCW